MSIHVMYKFDNYKIQLNISHDPDAKIQITKPIDIWNSLFYETSYFNLSDILLVSFN